MEAANKIREAVEAVGRLRHAAEADASLRTAIGEVKRLQARRFSGTYADLLGQARYGPAARFFLEELYSDKDYAQRDAQFARIAPAIERLFPESVTETAVNLAQLHQLTEELDQAMAGRWALTPSLAPAPRYVQAWREVGRAPDRALQLSSVLEVGRRLARLTRTPGLRVALRMMRGPATAAGLASLQRFLESGFDTFAGMAREAGAVEAFLSIIEARESALMESLFGADRVACETELEGTLGQAR